MSQASGDITRRVGEPRHEAYIARRPLRRGFVSVLVTDDDGVRDDADGVGSGGTPRPRAAEVRRAARGEDAVLEAWRSPSWPPRSATTSPRTGSSSTCTTAGVRCVTPRQAAQVQEGPRKDLVRGRRRPTLARHVERTTFTRPVRQARVTATTANPNRTSVARARRRVGGALDPIRYLSTRPCHLRSALAAAMRPPRPRRRSSAQKKDDANVYLHPETSQSHRPESDPAPVPPPSRPGSRTSPTPSTIPRKLGITFEEAMATIHVIRAGMASPHRHARLPRCRRHRHGLAVQVGQASGAERRGGNRLQDGEQESSVHGRRRGRSAGAWAINRRRRGRSCTDLEGECERSHRLWTRRQRRRRRRRWSVAKLAAEKSAAAEARPRWRRSRCPPQPIGMPRQPPPSSAAPL